jgi:phytoene dehydrogenase-like protein
MPNRNETHLTALYIGHLTNTRSATRVIAKSPRWPMLPAGLSPIMIMAISAEKGEEMTEKTMIIIGAGIGGLATGCYAQMNGYRTQIFEMHSVPGGLCASWKRNGYTFDGCIHHLAGCLPESGLYPLWEELGAMPRPMHYARELVQAEDPAGNCLTVFTDLDQLARHLAELAPKDAKTFDELVRGAKRLRTFDAIELAVASPVELLKSLPILVPGLKWMKMTMAEAAQRLQNPFLRRVFPSLQYDSPANPVATFLNLLAQCERQNWGWPQGGSLPFARDIAQRYLDLGGQIHYRAEVERILVESDRAVGVRLAGANGGADSRRDGREHRASVIVSSAYGPATVLDLLQGGYMDERLRARYAAPVDEISMGLMVGLGVARDLSQEPHALVQILEQPVTIAGRVYDRLYILLFGLDPSMAPPGKGVLKVELATSYSHWQDLYRDRERYDAEKQRVAEVVIDQLEPRFPGLKGQIEVIDVATPMTTKRYTGNAQAIPGAFDLSLAGLLTGKGNVRTLPGLADFYMVGQSAGLPGLPSVAATGRNLVRYLCKQEKRRFVPQGS